MSKAGKPRRAALWLGLFLILYFGFEAGFVSLISHGAGLDDAELVSNISFWSWGYGGSQPPLYTWLAYGLSSVFGLHFTLLQFLRFAILGSGFFAVYLGLRGLNIGGSLAACAALSLFLLPQIGWESQRALIHSVLGTAGSAWSFAAFVWFCRRPSYCRAFALAAAFTAAILGKYNGLIFIAALLLSPLFYLPARRALATRYFAFAAVACLALLAPALLFMAQHPHGVVERAVKFHANAGGGFFATRLRGLLDLARAALGFALPALAVAGILGFFARRKGAEAESARGDSGGDAKQAMRFLAGLLLCGLALCALMAVFSGATHIKDRWLQPVLFLAPPFAALWLTERSRRAARLYGILGVVAACAVPPLLYANLYAHRAKPAVQNLDYQTLYRDLRANGSLATLLAPEPFYIGNLRLIDPQIKTLFAETPFAAQRLARPLAVLWKGEGALPPKLAAILAQAGIDTASLPAPRRLSALYLAPQGQAETVSYIYLP